MIQPSVRYGGINFIDHEFNVPLLQTDSSELEIRRQEEEDAVASILESPFIRDTESLVSERIIEETEKNYDIKFYLPNNASYLVFKDCGEKLGEIISRLLKRRSQKLSSFEAFGPGNEPLDLLENCSTLGCTEVWVQQRVGFRLRLELLSSVTLHIKAMESVVIEDLLSNIVAKHGLNIADLEVSVSRYSGHLEGVDMRQTVTSIDNTLVIIRNMTCDQTQEIVHGDDFPERPPRTSTPVYGHNQDIGGIFFNTTSDLMLREHSYSSVSRAGSVSSEPQNMRDSVKSVPGYHSLSVSVSELDGAEADQTRYFDKEAVTTPEDTKTTEESSLISATSEASSEMEARREIELAEQGWTGISMSVVDDDQEEDIVIHHDLTNKVAAATSYAGSFFNPSAEKSPDDPEGETAEKKSLSNSSGISNSILSVIGKVQEFNKVSPSKDENTEAPYCDKEKSEDQVAAFGGFFSAFSKIGGLSGMKSSNTTENVSASAGEGSPKDDTEDAEDKRKETTDYSKVQETVYKAPLIADFNKEQEEFIRTKRDKELPSAPWAGYNNEEDLNEKIMALSEDKSNVLRAPPSGVNFDFEYTSVTSPALLLLETDPKLNDNDGGFNNQII